MTFICVLALNKRLKVKFYCYLFTWLCVFQVPDYYQLIITNMTFICVLALNKRLKVKFYCHFFTWLCLLQVPDYYQLIKKPMDFQTMREKLNCAKYLTDEEFLADCLLVFQNCQQYNMEDTAEYNAGTAMARYLKKRATELGLKGVAHHNGVTRSSSSSRRTTGTKRKRTSF